MACASLEPRINRPEDKSAIPSSTVVFPWALAPQRMFTPGEGWRDVREKIRKSWNSKRSSQVSGTFSSLFFSEATGGILVLLCFLSVEQLSFDEHFEPESASSWASGKCGGKPVEKVRFFHLQMFSPSTDEFPHGFTRGCAGVRTSSQPPPFERSGELPQLAECCGVLRTVARSPRRSIRAFHTARRGSGPPAS